MIQVGILLMALSIHESAHAWSADRLGDQTARRLGRVSLNPLVHIDLFGTVLFPLVTMLAGGIVFGWAKPVPVVTQNLRQPRRDHALVAAAGPASNLVLAAVCLIGLKLALAATGVTALADFLYFGVILNVVLAVFNLFPIPPLDGSWILQGLLPGRFSAAFDLIRPYSLILLFALLYTGVFWAVLDPVLAFVRRLAL